uniref:Uncharacterized protein n=1 Tax=Triticum urartu TaxID=4572 RepID=A0A8R7K4R6_TRIUA
MWLTSKGMEPRFRCCWTPSIRSRCSDGLSYGVVKCKAYMAYHFSLLWGSTPGRCLCMRESKATYVWISLHERTNYRRH